MVTSTTITPVYFAVVIFEVIGGAAGRQSVRLQWPHPTEWQGWRRPTYVHMVNTHTIVSHSPLATTEITHVTIGQDFTVVERRDTGSGSIMGMIDVSMAGIKSEVMP